MNKQEYPYWMALAHMPKISNKVKNEIIVKIYRAGKSITDLFESEYGNLAGDYQLSEEDIKIIIHAKTELPNYSFMAEDLLEQGYEIIPIVSEYYSRTLKDNLKRTYSPPVIYTKGNKEILNERSIAIVGSRDASERALTFTDNVALEASKDYKVVVSGFAKGVDKQALDSAIKYKGQSIIVLPQGITTFNSGFKKYYSEIINGNVLVLSTFYPKAPWSVQLAMGRNPIIYGLAEEIFVAESSESGGTWSGVIDGLRKGRIIYVRTPGAEEKNANKLLISKGAVPVDIYGKPDGKTKYEPEEKKTSVVMEVSITPESQIESLLETGEFTVKEIISKLSLPWKAQTLTAFLKKQESIILVKKNPNRYTRKNDYSLFSQ